MTNNKRQTTYSDKRGIKELVDICVAKGMKHVIISPGSRNAPLSINFSRNSNVESLVIVDERSAAFFAIGIAQQSGKPVGLVCTSGTALLNYAPAIAEAYYQRIPLVVMSADRPEEWINQDDSQAIHQENAFANYVKASFQLPAETEHEDDLWYVNRMVNEALNKAVTGRKGPVHINVPMREPLYGLTTYVTAKPRLVDQIPRSAQLPEEQIKKLSDRINNSNRIFILAGLQPKNSELNRMLDELAQKQNFVVMTESVANLEGENFLPCIDRVVSTICEEEANHFQPDLLISFGGPLISKMMKEFLRKFKPHDHWFIESGDQYIDTYQSLTARIDTVPVNFFRQLLPHIRERKSNFAQTWRERHSTTSQRHDNFLQKTSWSDLKAFEILLHEIPENSNLQLGNSSVVRYAQLFQLSKSLYCNSNRGTSGIDGCTSTAVGAAWVSKQPVTLITGDLSFFYDSNALWSRYLTANLRIIVINNGGGGIFRFIPGPSSVEEFGEYFEATQDRETKKLVEAFDLPYYCAESREGLEEVLPRFYKEHLATAILEIKTPRTENDKILKAYFKYLKSKA